MTAGELLNLTEVIEMINSGRSLLLAGEETLLAVLPKGNWIGGTTAYFMTSNGGLKNQDKIFVTDITDYCTSVYVRTYNTDELKNISQHYSDNGFSIIILPGFSGIHAEFAKTVPDYDGVFNSPLVGWVSGVAIKEIGKKQPKVFAGNGQALSDSAAVMHISLPQGYVAYTDIINPFSCENSNIPADEIVFQEDGFSCPGRCLINGTPMNLAEYISKNNIDTRLPLVSDYNGVNINVSVQSVNIELGMVSFYAPVFKDNIYKWAAPVPDYMLAYQNILKKTQVGRVVFSCNCILNYLHANLKNNKTEPFYGPITFGEIGYILLNQTLVYLAIEKSDRVAPPLTG